MRDILDKYPIFVLRHELINVRTDYRLEKKKLTEILKRLKSIKKLTKNEIIELLINHNYDMSKLPKLEDLQKPKKPKQEPKPKIEEKPKPKIVEKPKILNNYVIVKNGTPDQFIKMKDDFNNDKYNWSLEAIQKGLSIEDIIKIADISETDFKLLNAFFTPDNITDKLLDYSLFYTYLQSYKNYDKTLRLLEPSGGVGNILLYLLDNIDSSYYNFIKIDFVEVSNDFIEIAKARLFKYKNIITFHNTSLFNFKPDYKFDFIIGNPPYKMNTKPKNIYDVDFFNYCYNLLDEDGKIAFLMSPSSLTLKTESHKKFKEILIKETETDKKDELIKYQNLFEIKDKFDKKQKEGAKAGFTNIETNLFVIEKNNY